MARSAKVLPAAPLLARVELRDLDDGSLATTLGHTGPLASRRRWVARMKTDGISPIEADRFATALCLRGEDIWGDQFDRAMDAHVEHTEARNGGRMASKGAPGSLVWEEPPNRGRRPTDLLREFGPMVGQLRKQPMEWARLKTFTSTGMGSATASKLRKVEDFADIEFRASRLNGKGSAVYGRCDPDLV